MFSSLAEVIGAKSVVTDKRLIEFDEIFFIHLHLQIPITILNVKLLFVLICRADRTNSSSQLVQNTSINKELVIKLWPNFSFQKLSFMQLSILRLNGS